MAVKERLAAYLKQKRITKTEFGRRIGVSSAYVSSIRRSIDKEKLKSIALNFPDLNMDWLLYGEGEMLKDSQAPYRIDKQDKGQDIPVYLNSTKTPLYSIFNGDADPINYLHIPGVFAQGAVQVPSLYYHPLAWNDYYLFERIDINDHSTLNNRYMISYINNEGKQVIDLFHIDQRKGTTDQTLILSRAGFALTNDPPIEIPASSITAIALIKARVRVLVQSEPWLY